MRPWKRALGTTIVVPASLPHLAPVTDTATSDKRPLDLWFSENLEAIAISIAMALVLKFFVVEAYQIPTGSMQPTILGDRMAGIADRIFADKLVTMLREPRRWEVMIFRFPLDERRLYVKRIVGLPGETLQVRGGDLWIDGEVAVKPDGVNESVLKEIFPRIGGGIDVGRSFKHSGGPAPSFSGTTVSFPGGGASELTLREDVIDRYLHGYDPDWGIRAAVNGQNAVPDLDVSGRLRLEPGAAGLTLTFRSNVATTTFALAAAGGESRATVSSPDGASAWLDLPIPGHWLPVDSEVEFCARRVDRQLVLWVDGEEWLRVADEDSPVLPERTTVADLSLTVDGAGQLDDVVVRRDIHYLPKTLFSHLQGDTWQIPDDSYFGMGDNTQSSHDSRTWETMTYELADGREISGFWFDAGGPNPPPDANPRRHRNGSLTFADVHGDEITFRPHEVIGQRQEPAPFIHRRFLLGKAVVVFWPVWSPFRWKLIR